MMKQIYPLLREMRNGDREDKMFYLASLREIGKFMKRLYNLTKNEKLKKEIFWLKNYLETYEI